jgi:hypothetical protein
MKVLWMNVRLVALIAAVCCLAALGAGMTQAQTVTASPDHLTFALPTGSTPPTSAQTVTFSATGSGSVNNIVVSIVGGTGTQPGDFAIVSDTCTGTTLTAPAACTVGVTFTPSQAAGLLSTATLQITNSASEGPVDVALSGAAGAIKLFDPTLVARSNGNASLSSPFTYGSIPLSLSCPTGEGAITGTLSSSPDGKGFVLEDNYLTLAIKGTPAGTHNNPAGNVCSGGPADNNNGTLLNDCFSTNYQVLAGAGQLNGKNPDTFANPDNAVLSIQDGNANNAGGLPPINVSTFLAPGVNPTTFTLLDGGGFVAGASLFLATNCSVAGVQTGGTITGNPIDKGSPGSLTPIFPFNSTPGKHIQFGANYLNSAGTTDFGSNNDVPTVTDTAISPASFPALVEGTSAGPAVCMRFTGELDANNNPQCKAFTITCTQGTGTEASGTLCPQSSVRNILFKAVFDSVDTPTSQGQIAPDTGPGFLMGTDNWATHGTTCTFENPGPLATQLCPQDTLTSFQGGDPVSGGTTRTTNSTFIPVLNMPLPITLPVVTTENFFGWQRGTTVTVKFFSSPAIYPFFFNFNPLPANGFTAAPIQSVTFGTNPAKAVPPVPDTTYPVPGDITLFNPGGAGGASECPAAPGGIFTTSDTITQDTSTGLAFAEGRYNLHFFATDCASTEELRFRVNSNPNANWASFKTVPVNIDETAPAINGATAMRSGNTVKVTYSCSDPALHDGTAGSGVVVCGTYLFFAVPNTGPLTSQFKVNSTSGTIALTAIDLAGNKTTVNVPFH